MVKGHLLLDVYTSRQETKLTNSWQSYQWRIFYRSYRWIAVFSQKACVLIPPNTVPLPQILVLGGMDGFCVRGTTGGHKFCKST